MSTALELENVSKTFGGLVATNDVSLTFERGARHALIGPNGAGKTTLVNLMTGRLAPSRGRIRLGGVDVTGLSQNARVRRGLVRNFQVTNLFGSFSAYENVALAVAERQGRGLRPWPFRGFPTHVVDEAEEIACRMRLGRVGNRRVVDLAYGQQRLVEMAVAMALKPRVLLLDEPAAGLPASDHGVVLEVIAELPEDVAVVLIEHDMPLVFGFAHTITVLAEGSVLASGSPDEIRADPRVRAAYLGSRHD